MLGDIHSSWTEVRDRTRMPCQVHSQGSIVFAEVEIPSVLIEALGDIFGHRGTRKIPFDNPEAEFVRVKYGDDKVKVMVGALEEAKRLRRHRV